MTTPRIDHVAIVGGGFSGALLAINLLRHEGPRATLVERRPQAGVGTAYSARWPDLLLNVRAGNMSALPDEPDHFVRWLRAQGLPDDGFVPRMRYGEYLAELLEHARARAPGRIAVIHDEAVAMTGDATVALAGGGTVAADAAVLAMGNLPPHPPRGIDPARLAPDAYAADPWGEGAVAGLGDDDTVLVIGTGLTMIDTVLLLDRQGFAGRIVALSRRGLTPRRHGDASGGGLAERPPLGAAALLAAVRGRARQIGWRAAVDELRPYTRSLWLAASDEERARFLRHLRPWWDVHRHRVAPQVADRIDALHASGRLTIVAGETLAADPVPGGVRVRWRPRGRDATATIDARRIVNCSGPRTDVARATDPLLASLRADGRIAADAMRLGLDVDGEARVRDAGGVASDRLYALGPLTKGAFWEITAVPDIRVQAWTLARRLSHAAWVGGEGL